MLNSRIFFIELAVANKAKYVCDIVELLYNKNQQIRIYTEQLKDANLLDQLLWTWKQDSFIPHTRLTEANEEAVLICSANEVCDKSDALILFDPVDSQFFSNYKYIIDFAETYDQQRLQASRLRFKKARDSGQYEIEFLKLGAFLRKDF